MKSRGEAARCATDIGIGMSAPPIAVVVDEELAPDLDEVTEEVDQRVALHP